MYDFTLPDYNGGSIVNLMSSITHSFGKKHDYSELKDLSSQEIKKYKNVVLLIIDGLGYNYLNKKKNSFLLKNLKSRMTSAFLSTTACANTAFLVGYPPQQNALTGWDINLKEVGAIVTILPFVPMYGGEKLTKSGFDVSQIIDIEPLHKGFNGKCFILIDKKISQSSFNHYVSSYTKVIPTISYKSSFLKLKKLIKNKSKKRRFIHVYFPEMDSVGHKKGFSSKEVNNIFWKFDKKIKQLVKSVNGTDTLFIIVSDHGQVEASKKSQIYVEDIPGMKECLTIPIAGEPRVRDCFVRPGKVKDFENIVKTKLSKFCWCFKGEQLIKDNFYGLGKPNPKLLDRVGDYVLIMKENYILKERLANSEKSGKFHKGKHGGVSDDEMIVPLILVNC